MPIQLSSWLWTSAALDLDPKYLPLEKKQLLAKKMGGCYLRIAPVTL